MVILARIEERIIHVQHRLDRGDQTFVDIEKRISDLELRMAKMGGIAALIAFVVPIVITILLRVLT
jgi:hypothetical protein